MAVISGVLSVTGAYSDRRRTLAPAGYRLTLAACISASTGVTGSARAGTSITRFGTNCGQAARSGSSHTYAEI
jgi:hypothetical protein